MKILVLSNCPLVESQGAGYVIVNYGRGLLALGHQVDMFGPQTLEIWKFLRKAKSHRTALGMLLLAIYKMCRNRYDVLEFYGAEAWLAISVLSRLPQRRFLMVLHSNGIETQFNEVREMHFGTTSIDGNPLRWYQCILKPDISIAFKRVDGLVTVSHYNREYAIAHRYQEIEKIVAIENPLLDNFLNQEVCFKRPPIIGFCGSWLPNKGTQIISSDLNRILLEYPNATFKLVGVGKEFKKKNWFSDEVLDRIEVIPFIEEKSRLCEFYHTVSIFILPSIYESFGLVATEAMACGCAVVTTKTGIGASLIHRQDAMIMQEPNSPFLYENLQQLMDDEGLRQRVARTGYRRVQMLNWLDAIHMLESTYLGWLKNFRDEQQTE